MKDPEAITVKRHHHYYFSDERGVAVVELAIILPLLILIVFAIVDFGRLFQARLVITNLAREGGSLVSRDIKSASDIIPMLQAGSSSLDLNASGRIYVWKIDAGSSEEYPYPAIDTYNSDSAGSLGVASSIGIGMTNLGLSSELYDHLVFNDANATADISDITVVEVFYRYTPITPITQIAQTFWGTPLLGNMIMSSKAVF